MFQIRKAFFKKTPKLEIDLKLSEVRVINKYYNNSKIVSKEFKVRVIKKYYLRTNSVICNMII